MFIFLCRIFERMKNEKFYFFFIFWILMKYDVVIAVSFTNFFVSSFQPAIFVHKQLPNFYFLKMFCLLRIQCIEVHFCIHFYFRHHDND